ncbi:PHP-associated domain-containing protein [Chloroflexota bacterium]
MIIDLHVHTLPLSRDSSLEFPEVIEHARKAGLDGFCVTEHGSFWDTDELARLSEEHNFLLIPGVELSCDDFHFLVFGLEEHSYGLWMPYKLRETVDEAGGVMILAHPGRRRYFENSDLEETVERFLRQSFLRYVDIVEVLNGRHTDAENEFAQELSKRMNWMGTGGSDAHDFVDIPTCATDFQRDISNLDELITEIKAGRFEAVDLRRSS